MMGISFMCLLGWIFTLRPEGEDLTVVTGHRWNPAAMERLTDQLTSINSRLVRLSKQ
jgi:hypothetical protein